MTDVTRESLAAAQDGPTTHKPQGTPFTSWTVLSADDADGVRWYFHVPTAALPSPAPEPPPEERLVDARKLGGNKGNAQYLAAQPAPDSDGLIGTVLDLFLPFLDDPHSPSDREERINERVRKAYALDAILHAQSGRSQS